MPTVCEEAWSSIEKLAKESGIPQTAIDQKKLEFEAEIKKLSKSDAKQVCETQKSIFSRG